MAEISSRQQRYLEELEKQRANLKSNSSAISHGDKTYVGADHVEASREDSDEEGNENDSFWVRHLVVGMQHLAGSIKPRIRGRHQDPHATPAEKLLACIRKTVESTWRRSVQEKLQDLVLSWTADRPEKYGITRLDTESLLESRDDFFRHFRAPTSKWNSMGTTLEAALAKTKRQQIHRGGHTGGRDSQGSPEKRKPWEALHTRGCADGIEHRTLRTLTFSVPGPALPTGKICSFGSGANATKMRNRQRGTKADTVSLLAQAVGESELLPLKKNHSAPDLPGWKDTPAKRRVRNRLQAARSECSAQEALSCEACATVSRLVVTGHTGEKPVLPLSEVRRELHDSRARLLARPVRLQPLRLSPHYPESSGGSDRSAGVRQRPSPREGTLFLTCDVLPAPPARVKTQPLKTPELGERSRPLQNPYDSISTFDAVQTDKWRYFQECERNGLFPKALSAITGDGPTLRVAGRLSNDPHSTQELFRRATAFFGKDLAVNESGALAMDSDSGLFSLRDEGLKDHDLAAVSAAAQIAKSSATKLDMAGNRFSDSALSRFLQDFTSYELVSIDLSASGAAHRCAQVLSERVPEYWTRLTHLEMVGCRLGDQSWAPLVAALRGQGNIRKLNFSDTGLGLGSQSSVQVLAQGIADMIYLEDLTLSKNYFFHEGCEAIAGMLVQTKSLRRLDLSYNASCNVLHPTRRVPFQEDPTLPKSDRLVVGRDVFDGPNGIHIEIPNFNPILLVCEALGENQSLRELSLAYSSIDFGGDCALLAAVEGHKELVAVDLTGNPHGEDGLRALLRMTMNPQEPMFCDIADFSESGAGAGAVRAHLGVPTGHFDLDLRHPQHRALLRWLLCRSEACGVTPPQASLASIQYRRAPQSKQLPTPQLVRGDGPRRSWTVPVDGCLSFDYQLKLDLEVEASAIQAVAKLCQKQRVRISLGRFVLLSEMFGRLSTPQQQAVFLKAVGETLVVKICHLRKFMAMAPSIRDLAVRWLYPVLSDHEPLAILDLPIKNRRMSRMILKEARTRCFFREAHPTDRYQLDLGLAVDRIVAESLHVINTFHAATARRLQAPDTSEKGNYEGARHVRFQGQELASFSAFAIGEKGLLELDYVVPPHCSPKRGDPTASDNFVQDLIRILQTSPCAQEDKERALRTIVHEFVLTLNQICNLLRTFAHPQFEHKMGYEDTVTSRLSESTVVEEKGQARKSAFQYNYDCCRVEAFVCLFTRCHDPPTLCTYECLGNPELFTPEDTQIAAWRLGVLRTMDALNCCVSWGRQPATGSDFRSVARVLAQASKEGTIEDEEVGRRHVFQLDKFEERVAFKFLLALSQKEEGQHFVFCHWSERQNLAAQGYDFQIPGDWFQEPAKEGEFSCTFLSESPQYRSEKHRTKLAERLLGWEPK